MIAGMAKLLERHFGGKQIAGAAVFPPIATAAACFCLFYGIKRKNVKDWLKCPTSP